MYICVGKLTIIGSDYGLLPGRRQAIILTNAGILLIQPLITKLSEMLIEIQTFSLNKIHLKMSSAKCCLVLNVLMDWQNALSCLTGLHPYVSPLQQCSNLMAIEPNYDITAATLTCWEVRVVTLKVTGEFTNKWLEVSPFARAWRY